MSEHTGRPLNRLAVYVIYDKDGIVDDYIPYFLNDIMKNAAHLIVVCNGEITEESKNKLMRFTDNVFIRPNIGFDCGAVQDVLINLYGWEKVYKYDELLIANDSFYGPLYPLEKVFAEMDKRDVDFWGLTESGGSDESSDINEYTGEAAKHIQSYFINIKKRLLMSDTFREFWESLEVPRYFSDAVDKYELKLTETFVNHGYTYGVYLDSIRSTHQYPYNASPLNVDVYTCIAHYYAPVVKRKSLVEHLTKTLVIHGSENANQIISYIEKKTNYDTNLIWDNLLRSFDISAIKNTLHLNYILSTKSRNQPILLLEEKKILVIIHMYYPELVDRCMEYIRQIPEYIDIVITTSRQEIKHRLTQNFVHEGIGNAQIRLVENHGRDIAALLIDCNDILMKYTYLCFTHDKGFTNNNSLSLRIQLSFMYILWENTLANVNYIENVLSLFEENPRLGFLAVPTPYHATYFSSIGNEWGINFDSAKKFAEKLGLRCKMSKENSPFSIGTAFWCRTTALKTLFTHAFRRDDFPAEPMPLDGTIAHVIERIFPYVAQHEGYFSGSVASDTYAAVRNVDLEYMVSSMVSRMETLKLSFNFQWMVDELQIIADDVVSFCSKRSAIWIYGAGVYANRFAELLDDRRIRYSGFVVTDGKPKKAALRNHPIRYISEIIDEKDNCGIIVAVSRPYKSEIVPVLNELGFQFIYEIS